MDQRISLVTLGVSDLDRARRFYCNGLGFVPSSASTDGVVFLQMGGVVLSLWTRDELAKDAGVEPRGPGFAGFALAINLRSKAEVDAAFAEVQAAGAKILKPPEEVFWGGYSGYFADPDGFAWELAWNPHWPLDEAGRVQLPER